ncbi:histidinol-phosphate aminotransferase [Xenorhabdus bovienii]|uniref:inositol monophosphatase family protein n=1 Tax=Xenorhabdus bovienii TaxID=40576 RepID=UPI0023B22FE0|nr:inositol monophosphatase family protein [Xenorhabdus bovienii]MDE9564385.1 histidinol-phosphate aminotransferase [Xenorhabdus bovienii]
MSEMELSSLLQKVKDIALSSFSIIEGRKNEVTFFEKKDLSIVSEADVETEKYIRDSLQALTPDIPVYGEELGCDIADDCQLYWLIDPIDGTAWYKLGMPVYGSLIALIQNGEPILGSIGLPAINTLVYAGKELGCFISAEKSNARQLLIESDQTKPIFIEQATITSSGMHGTSTWIENGDTPWDLISVLERAKLFKFSGDCIQHVSVLNGSSDAAIDTIMKPWDSAAIIVCAREAGLTVMDLNGNQRDILKSGNLLTAKNEHLAESLINLLTP